MSLTALGFARGSAQAHRTTRYLALFVIFLLVLELAHPETNGVLGGVATIGMYVAILAPIFWVARLDIDLIWLRRTVLLIWTFQSLSAAVGALQIYFPGHLQPNLSTLLSDNYLDALHITLSSGESILRPTGLTDTPGGAAGGAATSIVLALGLLGAKPGRWLRLLLVLSVGVGMFVLYLSQVRALVVMVGISVCAMTLAYAASGRIARLGGTAILIGALGLLTFAAAVSVGGDEMVNRLATLTESSPTEVYYTNRGFFLEHTLIDLLPKYPLGAGLARWGMMASYFGANSRNNIYVEIQWTGWLLDGGVLLILLYVFMLGLTLLSVWRATMRSKAGSEGDMSAWGAMLVGYDVGMIALMFNLPIFMSSFGLDFWLFNTAILVVCAKAAGTASPTATPLMTISVVDASSAGSALLQI